MQYLYHHVPKDFNGTVLYPLNELKQKYPEVYEKEVSKYEGREHVMQQRIPLLNDCLWNDVIFMTAVHPQEIFDARTDAGWGEIEPQRYFRISSSILDEEKLAVYLFKENESSMRSKVGNGDFVTFDSQEMSSYAVVPQSTKDYFRHEHESGQKKIGLMYRYIPHILYRGEIDVSKAEIITVS